MYQSTLSTNISIHMHWMLISFIDQKWNWFLIYLHEKVLGNKFHFNFTIGTFHNDIPSFKEFDLNYIIQTEKTQYRLENLKLKCKKCGNDIKLSYYSALTKEYIKCYQNRHGEIPSLLLNEYRGYKRFYACEKCNEPIDFKDMPLEMFFRWLEDSSEAGDSREVSGNALIRYFELDKLLESKKGAGD